MQVASGYEAVMKLAVEDPEWIPAVRACCEFAQRYGNHFAGSWIVESAGIGWLPNLKPLVTCGILEKEYHTSSGRRAYYKLIDPEAVGRALKELGPAAQPFPSS